MENNNDESHAIVTQRRPVHVGDRCGRVMGAKPKTPAEEALQPLSASVASGPGLAKGVPERGEPGVAWDLPEETHRRRRHRSGYLIAFASSIAMWAGILICIIGLMAKVFR